MSILQKIKDIEDEMARTQKNKATAGHLGMLKVRLLSARLGARRREPGSLACAALAAALCCCSCPLHELPASSTGIL